MNKTIVSLAMLKALWEERHQSYLDNFNVLICDGFRRFTSDIVSSPEVRNRLEDDFGLRLPLKIIEVLLKRATKTGFLRQEQGVYLINRERVDAIDFEDRRNKFLRDLEDITDKLITYAQNQFDVQLSTTDAETVLLDYIDRNSLLLAKLRTQSSYLPVPRKVTKSEHYIFASFINYLVDNDPPRLNAFFDAVDGSMLAGAIFFNNIDSTKSKFKNTAVYLDTKFLLCALGYGGESLREAYRELLDLLLADGAKLRCFEHTFDEVAAVLRATARNLRAGMTYSGFGQTYVYFQTKKYSESDILLFVARLPSDLDALKVETVKKPRFEEHLNVDEKKLQQLLETRVYYPNPQALYRDIASLAAIFRLRNGESPKTIEKCIAIFVTSNFPLVEAATEFIKDEEDMAGAPLAISSADLINLLWVKNPIASPTLPRKRVIADCYAAVQPDERFRRRYVQEIDNLEKRGGVREEDVYLLRRSIEALCIAMEQTVGDEEAFTNGTVSEVLEIYKEHIREAEHAQLVDVEEKSRSLLAEIEKKDAEDTARLASMEARATSCGRKLTDILFIISLVALIIIAYLTIPLVSYADRKIFGLELRVYAAATMTILSIAGLYWNTPLRSLHDKLALVLRQWLRKTFIWIAGM